MEKDSKIYLIGGGIASLSAAVYLIQDVKISGKNITIFDASSNMGGSLDAQYLEDQGGYVMRGIRMFEEKSFAATFELMSRIPSLDSPDKTLRDVFVEYNSKYKTCSKSRLVSGGKSIEQHHLRLSLKDRLSLITILFKSEKNCENMEIKDYFTDSFFKSNFWYEFCTVFAFEPWHSLIEFRRYLIRFIQDFPAIDTLEGVEITPYNQYESMILPILEWLKKQNVNFEYETKIWDIDFDEESKRPVRLHFQRGGDKGEFDIEGDDYLFITLGSMTANSSIGSMKNTPEINLSKKSAAWVLWENIASGREEFGHPEVFSSHIDKSKWTSFTITFKDLFFFDLMDKYVDRSISTFGGVNIVDSNWFLTVVLNYRPYFKNQSEKLKLSWGMGLFPDNEGNYVKKKMPDCSGEEILTEIVYHLGFQKDLNRILESAVCIPVFTPYVTSQFLPRAINDRPKVIPAGYKNIAFLGQFCEVPHDVVFTVDYSVRSAQTAVYSLFEVNKKVTPIYQGFHHLSVWYKALITLFR